MRDLMKQYYVYIITNKSHTIYIGVTNNIQRRLYEHTKPSATGFTARYKLNKLIYLETYNDSLEAIHREKQLKGWTRSKKMNLIKQLNPKFEEIQL